MRNNSKGPLLLIWPELIESAWHVRNHKGRILFPAFSPPKNSRETPKSSKRITNKIIKILSMATAISFAQFIRLSKTSVFLHGNGLRSFTNSVSFSSASSSALSSPQLLKKKWRQPVVSVLELGGTKIAKDGNFFPLHNLGWFYFSVPLAF